MDAVFHSTPRPTTFAAGLLGAALLGAALLAGGCDFLPAGTGWPGGPGPTDGPGPLVALDRMAPSATYYGLPGGLADNGAPEVTPFEGRIGLVVVSMSNGLQEFTRFEALYDGHPDVAPEVVTVNCAVGGNALEAWTTDRALWERCEESLARAGLGPEHVRVVWAKNANAQTQHGRTLPDPAADYYDLVANLTALARRIADRFPNVQAVYHSSRIYGGYARADKQVMRGEPLSYEGGLAINAVIEMQRRGELPGTPWMGWGPYLWANGATPNGSGIAWLPEDFEGDGVHPSLAGETKVAHALHAHFMRYDWYRR